jgi:hypothetical protein
MELVDYVLEWWINGAVALLSLAFMIYTYKRHNKTMRVLGFSFGIIFVLGSIAEGWNDAHHEHLEENSQINEPAISDTALKS